MEDSLVSEQDNASAPVILEAKPRRRSKDWQRKKVLELTARNVGLTDVAKAAGLPISTTRDIIERFKPVFKNLERADDYRSIKAQLLSAAQLTALESAFSGNKLSKAGFLSTIQAFDILNKAERLENNQTTSNIGVGIKSTITLCQILGDTDV